jgi:hypothetical protein
MEDLIAAAAEVQQLQHKTQTNKHLFTSTTLLAAAQH